MKHTALVLTLLASLPLGACAIAPGEEASSSDEQSSSTTEPLMYYVSNPAPTVIDFDRDPTQAAILDGATVDATYVNAGVNFTCIVCASGHAFARAPGRTGNGVSLFAKPAAPFYDARSGAVRADFITPRSWVSIDVLAVLPPEYKGTPIARPWFEAFNAAGQLIGSTVFYPSYGSPGFGQWQTLRIDDPTGSIKFVRFSSQSGGPTTPPVYAEFDNLTFNTDPYWINLVPIVKPPVLKPVLLQPAP